MWKRISAYLFDIILIGIVTVGLTFFMSFLLDYDSYAQKLSDLYDSYEVKFGVDFDLTYDEYDAMSPEESAKYDLAVKAVSEDGEVNYLYSMMLNLTLIMITFSILAAYLLLEFAVPLLIGNGQTLGKKIFGIALMRKDGVKINALLLFVRTVLGKFTLETMIPVLIIIMFYFNVIGIFGTVVILGIAIAQIVMIAATKDNLAVHDALSQTVAVDAASQMIFDSYEAMIEYKKKLHAEEAEKAEYR